jgi:uncharacterized protein
MTYIQKIALALVLATVAHAQVTATVSESRRKELRAKADSLTENDLLRLTPKAQDGDVETQYILGLALSFGTKKLKRNLDVGAQWLESSAKAGFAPAQNALAMLLLEGPSSLRDQARGIHLLEAAAAQDYGLAQMNLGRRYVHGEDVPANPQRGLELLRAAIDQRHLRAYMFLAFAYAGGMGVDKDLTQAQNLLRICAAQGEAQCQLWLGSYLDNGWGSPVDHALAADWYRKAAVQDNAEAQFLLGISYLNGEGIRRDVDQGEEWLLKASDNGHGPASFYVAKLCHRIFGRVRFSMHSECQAEYVRRAAEQGLPMAAHEFGKMLLDGDLGQKDPEAAYKWFLLAEELAKNPHWERTRPDEFAAMQKKLPRDKAEARRKLSENQISRLRNEAADWLKEKDN